jgi:hypothetical protein
VQTKFANDGSDDVEITRLDAELPGYESAPGGVRTNPLKAGRGVDLPVKLGAAPMATAGATMTRRCRSRQKGGDERGKAEAVVLDRAHGREAKGELPPIPPASVPWLPGSLTW